MNRSLPSQDSSPETFARLLNRLTHPPGPHAATLDDSLLNASLLNASLLDDTLSDDYAVSVSISRDGAAALNGGRKRTMAPVRVSSQAGNRSTADTGALSYENALRMHSRPRSVALPDLPPLPAIEEKKAEKRAAQLSQTHRAQAEAKALSALRQAKSRASTHQPSPQTTGTITRPRRAAQERKKATEPESGRLAQGRSAPAPLASGAAAPYVPQSSGKARQGSSINGSKANGGKAADPAAKASTRSLRSRQSGPSSQTSEKGQAPAKSSSTANASVQLEVASQQLALAQRQSIVSIRLSSIESEQLRQRAAESGISVSAYMRSCVLEAEHLRAQVKQALAELRASHPIPRPLLAQPQLEPSPLFSSIYTPADAPVRSIRPGLFDFLSGVAAIVLGRFQR